MSLFKKIVFTLILMVLVVAPGAALFYPQEAEAQFVVSDPTNLGNNIAQFFKNMGLKLKKTMGAVAFKNALSAFFSKLAYDAAMWVSTGGTGQQSLVYTQSFGDYMTSTLDGAAGTYISSLAQEAGFEAFNVCSPPSDLLKLNIKLVSMDPPVK